MRPKTWIAALALLALPVVAAAHEFWIEPDAYQVAPGDDLTGRLRVGENFKGSEYSYLPRNFRRFDMLCGGQLAEVPGRAGDRPALAVKASGDGLCVAIHVTENLSLTYRQWEKFLKFVDHKDFQNATADHAARGLPQTGFKEIYSRHAKSLIAVGSGRGSDTAVGLETEIVAEANPYTDDVSKGLPIRVFYEGQPRANAQVELFSKAPDESVDVTLHRTDDSGRVLLPVQKGHSYLADAVVLRAVEPREDGDPVWESLWASLTFAVPQ